LNYNYDTARRGKGAGFPSPGQFAFARYRCYTAGININRSHGGIIGFRVSYCARTAVYRCSNSTPSGPDTRPLVLEAYAASILWLL
jgi:hypothetical protein